MKMRRRGINHLRLFSGELARKLEVEAQILIARELGYVEHDESENLLAVTAEVGRILNGLCSLPKRN
jgi:hypothetical protein